MRAAAGRLPVKKVQKAAFGRGQVAAAGPAAAARVCGLRRQWARLPNLSLSPDALLHV